MSKKFFIILIIIFLIIFGFLIFNFQELEKVEAQPDTQNVWGWAFSKNIGWISFNNTTGGGGIDYGVNISTSTGNFSGYAWARGTDADVGGVGWIKFDPTGPYPAAPAYSACLDLPHITTEDCNGVGDWTVSGWARAYRAIEPEGQTLGDWDGWIKLRGPGYGVWLEQTGAPNEYEFRGWAWGGNDDNNEAVIGWISFNCKDRGICSVADQICDFDAECPGGQTCVSQQADGDTACTISDYKVLVSLVINTPPTAAISCCPTGCPCTPDVCTGYIGEFCLQNDSTDPDNNLTNSIWDIPPPPSAIIHLDCSTVSDPTCDLTPSGISEGTYVAQLEAIDTYGLSDIATTSITLLQDIIADFSCSLTPTGPWQDCQDFGVEEGVVVYFQDESTPSTGATINSWSWTFEDGTPASSNIQNPTSTFTLVDADSGTVTLQVSDTAGRSDTVTYQLQLLLPLPEWKEISPY